MFAFKRSEQVTARLILIIIVASNYDCRDVLSHLIDDVITINLNMPCTQPLFI